MHTRDFFYNNYKNHPEHVLRRIAGEYAKLTPQAQEALRDVLTEKGHLDILAELKQEKPQEDLSVLSKEEVRRMINSRLAAGESIDLIKMDLRDKGVDIYQFASSEGQEDDAIDERMISLVNEGKSKQEVEAIIQREFNKTPEDVQAQQQRMSGNGSALIIAGAVILLISVPLAAVMVQNSSHYNSKLFLGVPIGLVLLLFGARKRGASRKLNRE